jgi:hypothetical protein
MGRCYLNSQGGPGSGRIYTNWSRPMRIDVCSMFARMPRYGPAQPGIRSAARMRATGRNGSSRHVLEFFDSSSRIIIELSSGLSIRRFGVQVPGGTPVLTWPYSSRAIRFRHCGAWMGHSWVTRGHTGGWRHTRGRNPDPLRYRALSCVNSPAGPGARGRRDIAGSCRDCGRTGRVCARDVTALGDVSGGNLKPAKPEIARSEVTGSVSRHPPTQQSRLLHVRASA